MHQNTNSHLPARRIPLWLKIAYTAFMAVLIPVYWAHYGPTNFLYFCDVALLLTLVGVWTESARLISLPAVGILIPQFFWCADFLAELCGFRLTGMTSYMFDSSRPLFLRALSGFHGWLPFLLIFLLTRTGYDHRAFRTWTISAIALCLISFFLLPAPAPAPGDLTPRNVNYVYGMSDEKAQSLMPPTLYLATWLAALTGLVYIPTHHVLKRRFPKAA
jgi:hypothetical protein